MSEVNSWSYDIPAAWKVCCFVLPQELNFQAFGALLNQADVYDTSLDPTTWTTGYLLIPHGNACLDLACF